MRYGQHVSIDGAQLTAVSYPSGSGLGHALWVIDDGQGHRCFTATGGICMLMHVHVRAHVLRVDDKRPVMGGMCC